jgi:hypothetical protein
MRGRYVPAHNGTLQCVGQARGGHASRPDDQPNMADCPLNRQDQWNYAVFANNMDNSWGACFHHTAFDICKDLNTRTGNRNLAEWNQTTGQCTHHPDLWRALCQTGSGFRTHWDATTKQCYVFTGERVKDED